MLVELVMGEEFAAYFEMLKQNRAGACVLGENQIRLLQHPDGPEGHILKVSHRRRHYVEHSFFSGHIFFIFAAQVQI